MAWLDDRAWCHPKLVNLSDKAHRVYVNSLSYSSGMGLAGTLTAAQQRLVGATPALRRELIDARVWDERNESIYIHDWEEHNGKRDARKASDRERKRAARREERPADSPADIPKERTQSRRALKEVTEVKEETYVSSGRARDELWEALVAELGDPSTPTERKRYNAALKELREAEASPADIHARCRVYRRKWPEMALTPHALAGNWTQLDPPKAHTTEPVEDVLGLPEADLAENAKRAAELAARVGSAA